MCRFDQHHRTPLDEATTTATTTIVTAATTAATSQPAEQSTVSNWHSDSQPQSDIRFDSDSSSDSDDDFDPRSGTATPVSVVSAEAAFAVEWPEHTIEDTTAVTPTARDQTAAGFEVDFNPFGATTAAVSQEQSDAAFDPFKTTPQPTPASGFGSFDPFGTAATTAAATAQQEEEFNPFASSTPATQPQ